MMRTFSADSTADRPINYVDWAAASTIRRILERCACTMVCALRITGIPGFVIGDQIVRGATEQSVLQSLISQARKPK